jgi:hypothetical protein
MFRRIDFEEQPHLIDRADANPSCRQMPKIIMMLQGKTRPQETSGEEKAGPP